MGATGARFERAVVLIAVLLSVASVPVFGDQSSDAREVLSSVATALSTGNPSQALEPFDKSCATYDTLSDYFNGLTNAFQIRNEIDVVDETDTPTEMKLTVRWAMTLQNRTTSLTQDRSAEIHVRLVKKGKQWKIAEFAPIESFRP